MFDSGFLVGDVVFDVARTFNGKSFRMREHVDRLYRSLQYVRIDPGLSFDEMMDISEESIKRNEEHLEEAGDFRATMLDAGLDTIFLLSPTTSDARIKRAAELGRGFLYGISRLGVTGARTQLADGAEPMAARIRAQTQMPLALGFGVSTAEHVTAIGRWADAAVVGSAIVSVIEKSAGDATLESALAAYVQELTSGQ